MSAAEPVHPDGMGHRAHISSFMLAAALSAAAAPSPAGALKLEYLYDFATLGGKVRLGGLQVAFDPAGNEIFATGYGAVRIFNTAGVQTFSFRTDYAAEGSLIGVAALADGDLFLLTRRNDRGFGLFRANYRGEPVGEVVLSGIPAEIGADFQPTEIAYANGHVYLADQGQMKVLVLDETGAFAASYDLADMLGVAAARDDLGLSAFNVDREGNLLFTIAPLFTAYVVSPDGAVKSFGKPGSAPGKFNILSGIASDDAGRLYVADSLKSAVLVFDRSFNFLGEFGYRGRAPGNLLRPRSLAAGNGRVYVAQAGDRGVTVFRIDE